MSAMVDEDVVPTDADKTPVTIITGFLGSGKTTLVNYILKEQTDWKICVIENEFGEVSIDDSLVEENMQAREDIITMDNGCVCCSVRGDLVRTLGTLVSRRKEFQAIILETTGLADPSPIVFTFNSNAAIQDNYRIDSIVCLVDAKHIDIHLDEIKPDGSVNEAEHQVAFADRILINKVDLVTAEEYEDVEDRIRSINGFASIIKTEKSRAPLDLILGLNSFSLEQVQEVDPTIMDDDPEEVDAGHVHDENCDHGHVHDENCSHDADHGAHDHGHNSHAHEHNHDKVKGSVVVGTSDDKTHGHEHDHGKAEEPHDHNHEHVPKKTKKRHNLSLVSSVGFTIHGLLDVVKFNSFMSHLLEEKSADLYRTKGLLAFKDQGDNKFLFQGVHEQIDFGPSEIPWKSDEERISKMVFIGRNLDYEALNAGLSGAVADPATAIIKMHKRA